jgi:MFS family permease
MKRRLLLLHKSVFLLSISLFWLPLSALSDGINTLLLPERLLNLSASQSQATVLGLLSFGGLLAGVLIQPIAGAWSDRMRPRWGRKGLLAVGVLLVLLALTVFAFAPGLPALALGYLLVQVSLSVVQAAQQGFIPDLVAPKERGLASGMKNFMDIGGAMIGFVLLGQMLGAGQYRQAVLIIAGLMLAGLALTVLLVREQRQAAGAPAQPSPRINPFALDMRHDAQFMRLVVARFFFLLGTYAVGRFLLLFVAHRLGLSPAAAAQAAGNLLAGLAFVTVLAAPMAGWAADRFGRTPLMLVGAVVSAAGTTGYIFAGSLSQIFIFGCLLAVGSGAFASANWAMTADVVPKNEAARYFGIANFGTAGAAAAAGLFGPLVDGVNRSAPGGGFSALFIAAALAFVISAVSLRGLKNPAFGPALSSRTVVSEKPDKNNHRIQDEK